MFGDLINNIQNTRVDIREFDIGIKTKMSSVSIDSSLNSKSIDEEGKYDSVVDIQTRDKF